MLLSREKKYFLSEVLVAGEHQVYVRRGKRCEDSMPPLHGRGWAGSHSLLLDVIPVGRGLCWAKPNRGLSCGG